VEIAVVEPVLVPLAFDLLGLVTLGKFHLFHKAAKVIRRGGRKRRWVFHRNGATTQRWRNDLTAKDAEFAEKWEEREELPSAGTSAEEFGSLSKPEIR
jgi:heme oxygenase